MMNYDGSAIIAACTERRERRGEGLEAGLFIDIDLRLFQNWLSNELEKGCVKKIAGSSSRRCS
jgi:hypothetical protein